MDALQGFRQELDAIDEELVRTVARRLQLCDRIAGWKRENGIPMMQPHRIEHVKRRCTEMGAAQGLDSAFVESLYTLIIDEACRREERIIEG
ncbi:chorismate mutase [Pyxidicoccus sp. MSG2]|uniref:chorismate mutase n=1 Tax=Pyxidicoccus sp. MSG2 TaxID=2996790 RepID=UPI00226F298E|nr:chorismate mutase [Pyxidicoccus sp. MSG2]MCY1021695.1 chorismate mutase [Pyxidicoccus sp. MSG2]